MKGASMDDTPSRIQNLACCPLPSDMAGKASATYIEVKAGAVRSVSGQTLSRDGEPVHGLKTSVLLLLVYNIHRVRNL